MLNTFVNKLLEIDQLGTGLAPEDANLFVGLDPADNSASAQKPTGGPPPPFIDWDDLASNLANHRLLDPHVAGGKDPDSFPHANECVGGSNVLSKMDLTYVAAANNQAWAYFAVQRSNNNGDAGYYWLFTKKEPRLIPGQAPCSAGERRLLYDISVGDVLLAGHFHPGVDPLLRVWTAKQNTTGTTAVLAIDFTNGALWAAHSAGVEAVAVNTTITRAGALGSAGVLAVSGPNVESLIFAESAVPVNVFTGGNNCGARFFGSVITRSSGSGGTSPDLKDLAGPAVFNFGSATAEAKLTPSCTLDVTFEAKGFGFDGQPMLNPMCTWTFDDGTTATGCTGVKTLAPGARTGTVTVQDPNASACVATVTSAPPITVFPPVAVTAELEGSCLSTLTYSAAASGGSGAFSYQWTFGAGVSPSDPTASNGTATVAQGGIAHPGEVVATDTGRSDGLICTATANDDAVVYKPISATAAIAPTCGLDVDYAVTSTSGGDGAAIPNPICEWTFDDGTTATGCTGVKAFTAAVGGTLHGATVKVIDPAVIVPDLSAPGCSDTAGASVTVYPPLAIDADLVGSCLGSFSYSSGATGGSGHHSYQWSFGEGVSPSSLTEPNGTATVATGALTYPGTVVATDVGRSDSLICTVNAGDEAVVYKPIDATAQLSPTCDLNVGYGLATTSGGAGGPIANPICEWTFDDGTTATGCSGVRPFDATVGGTPHTASVRVMDPAVAVPDPSAPGCSHIATAGVTVYPPLALTAELEGSCLSSLTYSAAASGGSGQHAYLWSFGPGVTPTSLTDPSGTATVAQGGITHSGTVLATDTGRGDGLVCTQSAGDGAVVYKPTSATAALQPTCGLDVGFALASTSGGAGGPIANPTCLWTFDDGSTAEGCTGIKAFTANVGGTPHLGSVKVIDPDVIVPDQNAPGCSDIADASVTVYPPLAVTADLEGSCLSSLTYAAAASGGSGLHSYQWSFGEGVTPSSLTDPSGTATLAQGGIAHPGNVVATDTGRGDGLHCTASAGDGAVVYHPTSATAQLRPSCTLNVEYEVISTSGGSGGPIANPLCEWTFDDGSTAIGCSGARDFSAVQGGTPHGATVKVIDPSVIVPDPSAPGCSDTDAASVTVYPPLAVDATLTGTCESKFSFDSTASGGTGHFTYLWNFISVSGQGSLSITSSPNTSGLVEVSAGNEDYQGTLAITDTRPDGLSCPAGDVALARVFHPIKVNLARAAVAPTCAAGMTSDEAHYAVVPTGGSGNYAFTWNGAACAGPNCTINPADDAFCYSQSFSVTAADTDPLAFALCLQPTSEIETYSKLTLVEATDN